MSDTVMFAVLGAALLHAVWNALLKGSADKSVAMLAVVLGHVPYALVALPFVDAPARASWPLLGAGIALHVGYQACLVSAYRLGDLSQVYPIARGSAPLIVTIVSVAFLGVVLDSLQLLAVLLIVAGIASVCLVRRSDGALDRNVVSAALATGAFIAGYSLVDGLGARASGSPIGFYVWETFGNASIVVAAACWLRPGALIDLVRSAKRVLVVGGGASFLAYGIVMWAFTQAPIALVTALRETSIVFALLIGVFHLKERLSVGKVLATFTTLAGAALLRVAR